MFIYDRTMVSINSFKKLIRSTYDQGQIRRNSELGRWLYLLSTLDQNKVFVEIGTWNGRGSTQIICKGISTRAKDSRNACEFHGYEIDPAMYRKASRLARNHEFLKLHFGSIIKTNQLDRQDLSELEKNWLIKDEELILLAPNVLSSVPREIHVLLLDGGEFSTFAEFQELVPRVTGWIALDDTKVRKCRKIVETLDSGEDFRLVFDSDERNGVAIYMRI